MSNIDHQSLAITNRGAAAAAHVAAPSNEKLYPTRPYRSADGQILNLPVSQLGVTHASDLHTRFAPSTAMPSLASESQIDIRIPAGSVGAVRNILLEVDLKNDTVVAATIAGDFAQNMLARVELLGQSGSVILQRWTNTALMTSVLYDSPAQFSRRQAMQGVPATGIPAGEEFKAYIKLPGSFFNLAHVTVQGITSDLFVRVVFRPEADVFTASTCVLTAVNAHVHSINHTASVGRALADRLRKQVNDYRFHSYQEMSEIMTLAPSTNYEVRLSSVLGLVSDICVWIRAAGHTGYQTTDSNKPVQFSLNDASGKSILGSSTFSSEIVKYTKDEEDMLPADPMHFFIDNTLWLPLAFSPRKNRETGSLQGGYYPANGDLRFNFTTDSAIGTGQYEVMFVYSRLDRIRVDGGQLSHHSS